MKVFTRVVELVDTSRFNIGIRSNASVGSGLFFVKKINRNVYPGGGTGRHAGLKILFPAMEVWVQLPSRVLVWLTIALTINQMRYF